MAHYWISFYRTGDPNKERLPGSPEWPRYNTQTDTAIVFSLPEDGGIRGEVGYRKEQCDYWQTLAGFPGALAVDHAAGRRPAP